MNDLVKIGGGLTLVLAVQGCVIGYDPIGGDEGADEGTVGDGDEHEYTEGPGTEGTEGTDETEGNMACTIPGELASFDYTLALDDILSNPDLSFFEQGCAVDESAVGKISVACPGSDGNLVLDFEVDPLASLTVDVGATVTVHLVRQNDDATWLRLDFIEAGKVLTLIDGPVFEPQDEDIVPDSLTITVEDACSPFDDACGSLQHDIVNVLVLEDDSLLQAAPAGDPIAAAYAASATTELWVRSAWHYEDYDQMCQKPQSWHKLLLITDRALIAGEVCDPGNDACGPGLACCYPCGIPDCEFVCQAEDPMTMECPPPPP